MSDDEYYDNTVDDIIDSEPASELEDDIVNTDIANADDVGDTIDGGDDGNESVDDAESEIDEPGASIDGPEADTDGQDSNTDETSEIVEAPSKYSKEIIVVKPENRRTSNIMSKYEMTEYISIRATQISQHNNCMVDTTGLDDPVAMAKRELMMRKTPLVIRRHVGDIKNLATGELESYYEFWHPAEMAFATTYPDVL